MSDVFSFFPYYMGDYVVADFVLFFDVVIFVVGWLVCWGSVTSLGLMTSLGLWLLAWLG